MSDLGAPTPTPTSETLGGSTPPPAGGPEGPLEDSTTGGPQGSGAATRAMRPLFVQRSEPFSAHTVAHVETETGQHIFRSANGELSAHEEGPYLRIERIDVDDAARGKGEGTAMMEQALAVARAKGLTLGSDVSVSPAQRKVYRALANRGWDVRENPASINPVTKNLVSADPRVPVYEVRAPRGRRG